ncbi:probable metal-nicotianamine transporter YSL7 [Herrania umbratica]|uniref:Probable metal-nicotianamine transporter YSL7 n=1 Tax=Herrania umbratica TaxID=108875 RepID=A0A6J1AHL8_9ROSI|nr:probable metal-nicotianamine transporter YSL7 [Herrania umbratica]
MERSREREEEWETASHETAEAFKTDQVFVEDAFRNTQVPSWTNQITLRAVVTSLLLSLVFNFIVCKLNLTTGVIPSLNVAAGLLGFAIVKAWTTTLAKVGFLKQPFTRQENTVIQTCVVASSGIAFSGGTASYLLGMSPLVASQGDGGNTPENVKKLSIGWMMGFLFVVSFVGLFSIVPLRKIMILKYKLTYPSGTATAYLINSFHTPKGAKLAKKQVAYLFKSFVFSFLFAFFQWFYTAIDGCGFASFPTFGLQAFNKKFYFDFSSTYVGVGMICPYMVNVSLLIGAIISWGIMWPMIESKKGIWYSANLSPGSLHGIQGYRVFIAIAMMLGDGLYHVLFMLIKTIQSLIAKNFSKDSSVVTPDVTDQAAQIANYDEHRRTENFLKDQIPNKVAMGGYIVLAVISIIAVPFIFHQLKWYHILVAYAIAPVLAFCNAYGCGLTDWSLASNYGKLAIIIFSSWVGLEHGGIIAGLASCGVMMSIVSTASDLMQDFKTGYLTLSSPRSMFFSQVLGTAMGCFLTPLVFWFFYNAYPIGDPSGTYPAPYGLLYRGIALLGVEGISSLPKNCLNLVIGFFLAGIFINLVQEFLKRYETRLGIYRFIPSPMCMAIPFYLGGYFAIDMCIGSLILFLWEKKNKQRATDFAPAVASGLICGDSLWSVPAAILALLNVNPPICMKFLSASVNAKVDKFLDGS